MREERACKVPGRRAEKSGQVGGRLLLNALHVRVEPLEKQRPHGGSRVPCPETAYLRLLVNVIATQAFIRSLARNDYFEAARSNESGKQKQRRRRGAKNRLLGVPDHLGKDS